MLPDVDPCKWWYPVEMDQGPLICPKLSGQETARLSRPLNLSDCWSCTEMTCDTKITHASGTFHSKLLCWLRRSGTSSSWHPETLTVYRFWQHYFGLLIPPRLFSVSDAKLKRSKGIKANASMTNLVMSWETSRSWVFKIRFRSWFQSAFLNWTSLLLHGWLERVGTSPWSHIGSCFGQVANQSGSAKRSSSAAAPKQSRGQFSPAQSSGTQLGHQGQHLDYVCMHKYIYIYYIYGYHYLSIYLCARCTGIHKN
jgi:hypothetical protein